MTDDDPPPFRVFKTTARGYGSGRKVTILPRRIGAGDNHPPPEAAIEPDLDEMNPEKLVDPAVIQPLLTHKHPDFEPRAAAFIAQIQEWITDHTPADGKRPVVADDGDCGDALDFRRQLTEFIRKEVAKVSKATKGPLDKAGKEVLAWERGISEPIAETMRPLVDAVDLYVTRKEELARLAARRLAQLAHEEAARLIERARREQAPVVQAEKLEEAKIAEDMARQAALAAEASVADLSRVRSDMDVVSGLRVDWKWELVEPWDFIQAVASGRLRPEAMTTNDVYISKLVREQKGAAKLPGIRVYEVKSAR